MRSMQMNQCINGMKAIEQYFHVVLFIMLYKVVLAFKSVDKTLVCDRSNESYWAVLSCCGTWIIMLYIVVLTVKNGLWMKP